MSIVCLLFVAIIPLCSINIYNYSQAFSTTSQEETLDDGEDNLNNGEEGTGNEEETVVQDNQFWNLFTTEPLDLNRDGVYEIGNARQLAWLISNSAQHSQYILTTNINLSEHLWVPIFDFKSSLNGNGYTISGLRLSGSLAYDGIGFIEDIEGDSSISDLILEGSINVVCNYSEMGVGGFVGGVKNGTLTITNCVNKMNITISVNSTNTFTGQDFVGVGGIIGRYSEKNNGNAIVRSCINFGNITFNVDPNLYTHKEYFAGGIVGCAYGIDILNCVNYGNVTSGGKFTGGITGLIIGKSDSNFNDYDTISNCINYGDVQGKKAAVLNPYSVTGGIAGQLVFALQSTFTGAGIVNSVNLGGISGAGNNWGASYGTGELAGWAGGNSVYCYGCWYRSAAIDPPIGVSGVVNEYTVIYTKFDGEFDEYYDLFSNDFSRLNNSNTWTGTEFYSTDVTSNTCPNSAYPVTLSHYVKDMNIRVKIWDDGELVDFTGDDFKLSSDIDGLLRATTDYMMYDFYATVNKNAFTPFKMENTGGYEVSVYYSEDVTSNSINGDPILGPSTATNINYGLTGSGLMQGTYSSAFSDITIVLEKDDAIPIPCDFYRIWTSRSLYNESVHSGHIPSDIEQSNEGLGSISVAVDGTVIDPCEEGEVSIGSIITLTITPSDKFEILGVYAREDFNTRITDRRLERFNDVFFEGVEGEEEARNRVTTNWYSTYSRLVLTFKLSDLVLSIKEDSDGELEYTYVSALDIVFVAYRQDYDLTVNYLDSESTDYNLEKGYIRRVKYAERSNYRTYFYYSSSPTSNLSANTIDLRSGNNYFTSSLFVEYVADIEGEVDGYWSSSYGTSVSGLNFMGSYVRLTTSTFFATADPWSYTEITFKYCESPRYDYTYTIYITDAYEEYGTGEYLPGQLVGETDYYGITQISKTQLSIVGQSTSLPATTIPTQATYREVFNFDRNNVLNSDFLDGVVDTSQILMAPSVLVGGRNVNIYSVLSGGVILLADKEPITGYRAGNALNFSTSYNNPNTTNLANYTLYDIISTYGNLNEDGNTVVLYTFFHLRNPYDVVIQTAVDGVQTELSMPAGSSESIVTAFDMGMSGSSLSFRCEPFAMIDIDVTDKLVYRYDSLARTTTFYSFDNVTLGSTILSESGTYTFQGMPTNDISSYVISVNFKEEFTISNSLLDSDTSINYNSSIWYVDSDIDLLNIAYRMYCQGLEVAKKLVQTADIDFEDGYMIPIGTESNPFTSVYDGQYYRIENMTINGGNAEDIGLFGYTSGATIKNLTLMNAEVNGGYDVGTVVGQSESSTFERVGSYNGRVSMMETQSAGMGIFLTNGYTATSVSRQNGTYTYVSLGNNSSRYTLLSVMVADEITNNSDQASGIGDFAGRLNSSEIDTCFVRKSRTIDEEIGGFVGNTTSGTISYAYTSRMDFVTNTIGTSMNHIHTQISDITTCPECADRFIW